MRSLARLGLQMPACVVFLKKFISVRHVQASVEKVLARYAEGMFLMSLLLFFFFLHAPMESSVMRVG